MGFNSVPSEIPPPPENDPPPPENPPPPSPKSERRKRFFKQTNWHLSKKTKAAIAISIIAVILVSTFAFLPKGSPDTPIVPQSTTPPVQAPVIPQATNNTKPSNPLSDFANLFSGLAKGAQALLAPSPTPQPGPIASALNMSSTVWLQVAYNAWQYYQYDNGVDSNTGLPEAGQGFFPYFTDWDLGDYIQAILDAQNVTLISDDEAHTRLDTVLTFLENRPLMNNSLPYWWYQTADGLQSDKLSSGSQFQNGNVADTGNLLVALKNVELYNSSLVGRVNNIVYKITNYSLMFGSVSALASSNNIYDYYVAGGFACFWPQFSDVSRQILNNIVSDGNVTTPEGVKLPLSGLSNVPLFMSIFDLPQPDQLIFNLTKQVYLAHEAYYNATGNYRAFGEGDTTSGKYAYEWVVFRDGRTWTVLDEHNANFTGTSVPVIYTDSAFSFLALYDTQFARKMCVYLEQTLPTPSSGYFEGIGENDGSLPGVTNNQNGLILSAARYYIANHP